MISTSWSTPLSPGKIGWPSNNSANTHPALQISGGGRRERGGGKRKREGGENRKQELMRE